MKSPYLYLRGLRHADHTVFCVQDGQKTYWDPQFRRSLPFSSGQQVKRSIMEQAMNKLGRGLAPVEFRWKKVQGKSPKEDIAVQPCDPSFPDQLLGGYMKAESNNTVKRRSPLSISAMRPLHPLLAGTDAEEGTFDRTENPASKVTLLDEDGNEMSSEELSEYLDRIDKRLPKRKFLNEQTRAYGLFVYDVAIDLRRLFSVSIIDQLKGEPEVYHQIKEKLQKAKWVESENSFGPCLVCPKDQREKIIPALADSLLSWRITSNQARTFSLMEPLAFALSDKAPAVAGAIRAELSEDVEKNQAVPRIDKNAGADVFVTLPAAGYIKGEKGSADAIKQAKDWLVERMSSFDYENQSSVTAS
ncbi:MAG: CRISPR-associated protein Cas7 [Patescibacteria group bacterium]|nr:CRISPR-associated protein Cas7 [Patescibacteria group bacterium]